jgi:hypothetical protein
MTRVWVGAILILAVVTTAIFGAIYVVAQQIERQDANDSPSRLASQIVSELNSGGTSTLDSGPRIDLTTSLAEFYVVYDETDTAISGTGYVGSDLATLPAGVIDAARASGEDTVSWQPRPGLRFATVAVRSDHFVVVAGQSLAPSESRTDAIGVLVAALWAVTMALLAAGVALLWLWRRRPATSAV